MTLAPHVVLIPGAGSDPAYWEPLRTELAALSLASTAVDLPCTDPSARLTDYAEVAAAAVRDHGDRPVLLVAHSFGAFTAGLVADLVPLERIILVAPMIPTPGESGSQWWEATGQAAAHEAAARAAGLSLPVDPDELFYNSCTHAQRRHASDWDRDQAEAPFVQPWPRAAWPAVPTEVIALAEDLLFPPEFLARVARDRLGLPVRTSPGGHMGMVSHPVELVEALLGSARNAVGQEQ
ncbi:alpha/beta fold hydrolase [Ruania zhangjianzhongii]|uniref:alpha/beta fold hydrolase n=1 Tax=Ruania zhangjianzhongii TaxID=2603206 RepID=UPI00143D0EEE|nr:alpha/beta hydrolase [Ruania zhangjianzhongii]